jgi:hypothetical protein
LVLLQDSPKKSSFNTICDGFKVYKNLKTKTKNFFLKNQIIYNLRIPFGSPKKRYPKKLKLWIMDEPGIFDCKIDLRNKEIFF